MIMMCNNCRAEFSEDLIVVKEEPMGEAWGQPAYERRGHCPMCGSDDIAEENYIPPELDPSIVLVEKLINDEWVGVDFDDIEEEDILRMSCASEAITDDKGNWVMKATSNVLDSEDGPIVYMKWLDENLQEVEEENND